MARVKAFFKKGYWSSPVIAAAGVINGGWLLYVAVAVLLAEVVVYKWLLDQATDNVHKLLDLVGAGTVMLRKQADELERAQNARWN